MSIRVKDLADIILKSPETVIIVDVRQHDYTTGCIKNSLHVPFDKFPEPAVSEIRSKITARTELIVSHCHFCQNRGPKAARMISDMIPVIPVFYLEGGWEAWFDAYSAHRQLTTML